MNNNCTVKPIVESVCFPSRRNEIMAVRTSQHDLVTQQLMDLQRKVCDVLQWQL